MPTGHQCIDEGSLACRRPRCEPPCDALLDGSASDLAPRSDVELIILAEDFVRRGKPKRAALVLGAFAQAFGTWSMSAWPIPRR